MYIYIYIYIYIYVYTKPCEYKLIINSSKKNFILFDMHIT